MRFISSLWDARFISSLWDARLVGQRMRGRKVVLKLLQAFGCASSLPCRNRPLSMQHVWQTLEPCPALTMLTSAESANKTLSDCALKSGASFPYSDHLQQ